MSKPRTRTGRPIVHKHHKSRVHGKCYVFNCKRQANYALGLCHPHYMRFKRYGSVFAFCVVLGPGGGHKAGNKTAMCQGRCKWKLD